ncbi:MAG TPA: response regulator [Nitrospirota bacterium]
MTDRESRTILLVDGSATTRFYLGMLLGRLEYGVVTAQSAEEALRMMGDSAPSIVLLETSLPDMSGVKLLQRIKETPRLKSVPVAMLTSKVDLEERDACLRLGCAAFFLKPVDPDELYRGIQLMSESAPRAHIRLATSLRVVIGQGAVMGGSGRIEHATAISEGGLFVRTIAPLPRNTVMQVRIFLRRKEIAAKAVVLYTVTTPGGSQNEPGMGMKFIELSDADRKHIHDFIEEQLTENLPPRE